LDRRALLAYTVAGILALGRREVQAAGMLDTAFEWFTKLVKEAAPSVEDIYRGLLRIKSNYRLLVDDKARLNEIRRKLTDPSSEKGLHTKLEVWLKRYQAFAGSRAKPGESDAEYTARREKERQVLENDWKQLRNDALDALKSIEAMGIELQSIDADAMNGEEWRRYKELLRDEKEYSRFLDADMPTDPVLLDRMAEAAKGLNEVVEKINRYAADLDQAIKRAEPARRT
jgi:hypothetical protein